MLPCRYCASVTRAHSWPFMLISSAIFSALAMRGGVGARLFDAVDLCRVGAGQVAMALATSRMPSAFTYQGSSFTAPQAVMDGAA